MISKVIHFTSRFLGAAALVVAITSCDVDRATAPDSPESLLWGSWGSEPKLLICPTDESHTDVDLITAAGGLLSAGGSIVVFPPNALLNPQEFRLTVPASRYVEIQAYATGLESFLFELPVIVTIDYSRCTRSNIFGRSLSVWHIDPVTKELLENMGGVDNPLLRQITFTTDHFSGYAIAY